MLGSNKQPSIYKYSPNGVCAFKMLGSNKPLGQKLQQLIGVCAFKMLGSNKLHIEGVNHL